MPLFNHILTVCSNRMWRIVASEIGVKGCMEADRMARREYPKAEFTDCSCAQLGDESISGNNALRDISHKFHQGLHRFTPMPKGWLGQALPSFDNRVVFSA